MGEYGAFYQAWDTLKNEDFSIQVKQIKKEVFVDRIFQSEKMKFECVQGKDQTENYTGQSENCALSRMRIFICLCFK